MIPKSEKSEDGLHDHSELPMNVFLLLIFVGVLLRALVVIKSRRAIEVFRMYALGPLIPGLLHMSSKPGQLAKFLSQSKLPFDKIYNGSCGKYIDRERFDEIIGWIKEDGELKRLVLAPECLSSLYLCLGDDDWNVVGRTYPLSEMMSHQLPMWPDTALIMALKEVANSENKLVESCTWLCDPSSSPLILQISMARWTGKSDAWSIFHHSCFTSHDRIDLVHKNDRIERIIEWLTKEVPVDTVRGQSEEHLMRWSIHLILILRSLSHLFDLYGTPAAKPIFEYLRILSKYCREVTPLITALIRGGTAFFMSDFKPGYDNSLPEFDEVIRVVMKGLTNSLKEQSRWYLAACELYYRSYRDFFENPLIKEDAIRSFERAPTIVQKHWTSLNLIRQVDLEFLDFHICWEVEGNTSLQRYLLSRIDSKASNALVNTVFTCVPEEIMVKEARWRFIYYTGYRKYLRQLYGAKTRTLDITSFVSEYLKKHEDLLVQYQQEKDLEALPEEFLFVLSVADLFDLATSFQITTGLAYDLVSSSKSWLLMTDF